MKAQTSHQVLSASGGDATGSGGSVAYSVGQIVYTTSTGTTGSVAHDIIDSIEISSKSSDSNIIQDFVQNKIYTGYSDSVLFTSNTKYKNNEKNN